MIKSKIAKIRQRCGLETDSKSRWYFLIKRGYSSNEAMQKVFEERGLIRNNKLTKKFKGCKK